MKNPIYSLKKDVAQTINAILNHNFLLPSDLSYNLDRNLLQSTKLFTNMLYRDSFISNRLRNIKSDKYSVSINSNYLNIDLSRDVKIKFLENFFQFIENDGKKLIPINYYISYSTKENLNNVKAKAFINSQINLINFYGYSTTKIFQQDSACQQSIKTTFELDRIKYEYTINNFIKYESLLSDFSNKFANLIVLSKGINSNIVLNTKELRLNSKNPYYITAHIIAKIQKCSIFYLDDSILLAPYALSLAELLEKNKQALYITPLVKLLIALTNELFSNDFYCYNPSELTCAKNIILFLSRISQTTFLSC